MSENVDNLPEFAEPDTRESLRAIYTKAIESPNHFGRIRLFHFKALPGALLTIFADGNHLNGMMVFYLGRHYIKPEAERAMKALKQFITAYLQAGDGPVEHPEFIEVPYRRRTAELMRARGEIDEGLGSVLMLTFKGHSIELPAGSSLETSAVLGKALIAFSSRVTAPGLWDLRPRGADHELVDEQPIFSLIAGGVLTGLIPLRCTALPLVWDDVGAEVFRREESGVTLVVLYTGDPTAIFAALSVPQDFPEESYVALIEEASSFIDDCGTLVGRPEDLSQSARFVRVTDQAQIRALLGAGFGRPDLTIDLISADRDEDRPSDLSFETLAQWALGLSPDMLTLTAPRAPDIAEIRVFRHSTVPLATLIAVTHSSGAATSVAGCLPIEMPEAQWPDVSSDSFPFVPPSEFEELSGPEGAQQIRRALALISADGALTKSYPVVGLPSKEVLRAIVRAVAEERESEFQGDLLSFEGIVMTWARGDEEKLTRPASFVARHNRDPELLMVGASFAQEHGLTSYLVASSNSAVSVQEVLARLSEVDDNDTLGSVLQHAGFEMLESDDARDAIHRAVERLQCKKAQLYDLTSTEVAH